jgi:hypothetical protein
MCRNIRVLHNFAPPTTPEEIHDAALQFIRKVSGIQKPSAKDTEAFDAAIASVSQATSTLLESLTARGVTRTREGEAAKAKLRWEERERRMTAPATR